VTIVLDSVRHVEPFDLPRVAKHEPVVGLLMLESVANVLSEHSVLVADAVAPRGQVQRGHRVQEASSEPTEASVPESCIAFLREAEDSNSSEEEESILRAHRMRHVVASQTGAHSSLYAHTECHNPHVIR
jgi:hypothetical protein